ncbi:AMP-binding protein, partial [Myxococcota bacterium]|nr:AMP-binding protein [Myxococcota bacterium]
MKNTSVKYPASIMQEQFWLINQIQPDNSAYNIPSLFRLHGHLDRNAMQHGIETILFRHEVLRSTFISENGKLLQVVHDDIDLCIDFCGGVGSLQGFEREEQERRIRDMIHADICQPFNMTDGPLLRVKVYRNSEVDWFLLIIMHHIITDLHSKDIFSSELSILYNAYLQKEKPYLENRITQYHDYSAWQQEFLCSEQYRENLSFWVKKIKDTKSYLNLPLDRQRPATQELNGAAVPFRFSAEFTHQLKRYSRQNNVTIFLVTLSAYLILLYRYSGQEEITIGIPFSNRRQKAYKETFGCFVNVLPLSFLLSSSKDKFADVLQQVRAAMLTGHRNQEVPYELLVKEVHPERDPSYNPLFQVGFTFEPPMNLMLQGLDVKSEKIHNSGAQLDLFANLWEEGEELHGMFEYNTDLFDKETVQRFKGHFERLLESVLLNSDKAIDQLSILPAKERDLLVTQWNSTDVAFPDSICVQHLFEQQAQKRPDSIACLFADSQLSYKELDERANKLAHYLQSNNVVTGALVGIYLERSVEMLIGLLAILKAGGAYVPLDPDFP